jgi:hypothetical protein
MPHDSVLVDQERDRHQARAEQVVRIHENRPVHALPLHEQPGAVGMLLLDDADDLQLPLLPQLLSRFVPPGHVPPAARSPGGEHVQDELPTAEFGQRNRTPVLQAGQNQTGEGLALHKRMARRRSRGGHEGKQQGHPRETPGESIHRNRLPFPSKPIHHTLVAPGD